MRISWERGRVLGAAWQYGVSLTVYNSSCEKGMTLRLAFGHRDLILRFFKKDHGSCTA